MGIRVGLVSARLALHPWATRLIKSTQTNAYEHMCVILKPIWAQVKKSTGLFFSLMGLINQMSAVICRSLQLLLRSIAYQLYVLQVINIDRRIWVQKTFLWSTFSENKILMVIERWIFYSWVTRIWNDCYSANIPSPGCTASDF